jgi:hypothetical protein
MLDKFFAFFVEYTAHWPASKALIKHSNSDLLMKILMFYFFLLFL